MLFNLKFENPKKIFPTLIESNINIFTNDGRSHFSQDSSDNISILVQMPAAHVPDAQYQRNTKKKYIKEVFQTKRKSVRKECTFSSDLSLKGFVDFQGKFKKLTDQICASSTDILSAGSEF